MEAMIITARVIGNDKFFEKAKEQEYERHINKIQEIMKLKKQQLKSNENEMDKISGVLKKAKQAAKAFQENEKNILRKKQNKILLQKLWKISQGRIIQSSIPKAQQIKKIKHRQQFQKKVLQHITSENRFLTKNILQQNKNKRSKSEIKQQIKEYLALRDSIRKKKPIQDRNKSIGTRSLRKLNSDQKKSKYADLFTGSKQPQQTN